MTERPHHYPGFCTFPGGRVPDGDTVPRPPQPTGPPVTRRQYVYGAVCAAIVAAAPLLAAVLR